MQRIELIFPQRPIPQAEFDRNIVKPAGRKATIEMPQARNDHPNNRYFDVRTRLIEHKEIMTHSLGQLHTGQHLTAQVEPNEPGAKVGPCPRFTGRH